mgnify:CR=1 FL=1
MRAIDAGILICTECHELNRQEADSDGQTCTRCGALVHPRRPNSILRTWALLLTAAILYIPANVLPIMTVSSLGQGDPSTIMSGVIALIQLGMVPIALVVFVASILVPTFKLVGIALLLFVLIINTGYWLLPLSELLYPERVMYFYVVPLGIWMCLVVEDMKVYFSVRRKVVITSLSAIALVVALYNCWDRYLDGIIDSKRNYDSAMREGFEWIGKHTWTQIGIYPFQELIHFVQVTLADCGRN